MMQGRRQDEHATATRCVEIIELNLRLALELFDAAPPHIVDRIRTVNIDELRPIEALRYE